MSIIELLEEKKRIEPRIHGVVVGIVTNNKDDEGLGRVKVKFPQISSEDESYWARVAALMAGKERGTFFLPEVDDEVLVVFENGEIHQPYIIGALWNGKDVPPLTNDDGKNNIRLIKSRSGHIIRLDDTDGAERIEIIDKAGNNKIIIDTKEKCITIASDKDIKISAPNGKLSVEAKELDIKTSSTVKMEASSTVDINASSTLTLKGSTVNIN